MAVADRSIDPCAPPMNVTGSPSRQEPTPVLLATHARTPARTPDVMRVRMSGHVLVSVFVESTTFHGVFVARSRAVTLVKVPVAIVTNGGGWKVSTGPPPLSSGLTI